MSMTAKHQRDSSKCPNAFAETAPYDHSRPSLEELRQRAHKPDHRTRGTWLARWIARPLAIYGTWLAIRLGLSAHSVTALSLVAGLAGALTIGMGTSSGFLIGVVLLLIAYWLDHVDGQVARFTCSTSLEGVYFDFWMHQLTLLALGYLLGYALSISEVNSLWTLAGFAVGSGWLMLRVHDDCLAKAHLQRLDSGGIRYATRSVYDAGSVGKRNGCDRSSIGLTGISLLIRAIRGVHRICLHLCEPPNILATLSVLGIIAWIRADLWSGSLAVYVLAMAGLAPTLALARLVRSVRTGSIQRSFDARFIPMHEADSNGIQDGVPVRVVRSPIGPE